MMRLRDWSALPLRLIVGYGFMAHGYAKLARGPEHFIGILDAIGLPLPAVLASATIVVEVVGGLAVLLGAFVLILVGVIAVQVQLETKLNEEIAQRRLETQRRQALEQALAGPLAAGRITLVDGRIGIRGSVLFALNSDQLQPEGRDVLRTLAPPLATYLRARNEALMVSGFTDDRHGVTLTLPAELAIEGSVVELVDPEGLPLAQVTVERTYAAGAGSPGVVGPVRVLQHHEYGAFRRLYLSPADVRALGDVVTVPVAGPLTETDLARLQDVDRPLVLLALAGAGTPSYDGRPLSAVGLIRATLAAAELLPDARVVAVPLASRGDADADHVFGERIVAAYSPGDVVGVSSEGELPETYPYAV